MHCGHFLTKGNDVNTSHQLTTIFCQIDDFCKELEQHMQHKLLTGPSRGKRGPKSGLSLSEMMTILVMFHQIRFRDFKTFYIGFVIKYWPHYFPRLPSYSRFVSLIKQAIFPLTLFVQLRSGKRTGIYYIDSSCLPVCHMKRSKRHRTFGEIAQYGRTSVGWFFGLKLHLVINDKGELMAFRLTQGNRHDGKEAASLLDGLKGLAFGDKGYIGKTLAETLFTHGLKLITRKRKNMKVTPLNDHEKQLLDQRGIIETVIGHLKHHYQIWHTRHRSVLNAMTHLIASLAAYTIEPLAISAIKLLQGMA